MCGGGSSGRRRSAGTTASGGSGGGATCPSGACPLREQARLVSVQWLDGTHTEWTGRPSTELGADGIQFVNFPRDFWWEAPRVAKYDRLGHVPPVRVRFNRPGTHHFRVRVTCIPAGPDYTATETPRSPAHFQHTANLEDRTDPDGTRILETGITVATAGGDRYRLEARDDRGTTRQSRFLEVRRRIYYYTLKMRTVPAAPNLADAEAEFRNHRIELVSLGNQEIDFRAVIRLASGARTPDETAFFNAIRPVVEASPAALMVPKVLIIAFVNYAVGKKRLTLRRNVTAGPSSAPVTIPVRETLPGGVTRNHALWRNLVPGEGWLVSARFQPASGAAVNIRDRCSAVGGDPSLQVRVRTAGLPAGAGTIRLVVDVEDGFRNGRTYSGTNLMIIATRANWQARAAAAQVQTIIHELGHQFGFAPDGTDLDRGPNQYTGHGHAGSHCSLGAGVTPAQAANPNFMYWGLPGTCVMFGENSAARQNAFCADCGPAMRKQDLCREWPMF